MDAAQRKRIVIVAASPEGAASALRDLPAGNQQPRVVADWASARRLMEAGEGDLVLCDADCILPEAVIGSSEAAQLRVAVTSAVDDLSSFLSALAGSPGELSKPAAARSSAGGAKLLGRARHRLRRVEAFLTDALAEAPSGVAEGLRATDIRLQDLVEGAAIAVYDEACRKSQRLAINIGEESARVHADPAKLKRALVDILGNVVRLALAGGTVTVDARRVGTDCVVAVSGSGEGIPSNEILHLFGDSETHSGVGAPARADRRLSVAREAVRQHGGWLWVESGSNRDTTVFVSLPQPAREPKPRTRRTTLPGDGVGHRE